MIAHMCDCCGKILDNNGIICSIPYHKKFQIKGNREEILGTYDTGKIGILNNVELCINCATTLADFFELECEEFSKKDK